MQIVIAGFVVTLQDAEVLALRTGRWWAARSLEFAVLTGKARLEGRDGDWLNDELRKWYDSNPQPGELRAHISLKRRADGASP